MNRGGTEVVFKFWPLLNGAATAAFGYLFNALGGRGMFTKGMRGFASLVSDLATGNYQLAEPEVWGRNGSGERLRADGVMSKCPQCHVQMSKSLLRHIARPLFGVSPIGTNFLCKWLSGFNLLNAWFRAVFFHWSSVMSKCPQPHSWGARNIVFKLQSHGFNVFARLQCV